MTGFGEANAEIDGIHYSVEIRSLNNKFFKTTVRLPEEIQLIEPEIDSNLRRLLIRGSITCTFRYSDTTKNAAYEVNTQALQTYIDRLSDLPHKSGQEIPIDVTNLMSLPGVLQPPSHMEQRIDRIRPVLLDLITNACNAVIEMRTTEGAHLHRDLHKHRECVKTKLNSIAKRAPDVIEEYHQRLKLRIETMLEDAAVPINETDLIREVAVYADRSDISEEISRLDAHLIQFRDLIDSNASEPIGRTLDFLAQEMLREANTIASKSNDSQISRDIVEVKGSIDRIKEQVQNVE